MATGADTRLTLREKLASSLFAVVLGAVGLWGLPYMGTELLHHLEVRRWDVSQCEIRGRRIVEYKGDLFAGVSHDEFTFEFDLREVRTGRHFKAYDAPTPFTHPYPEELSGQWWQGDIPGSRTACRIDPVGERAYLRTGTAADLGVRIFGTVLACMFILIGMLGVVGAVWELARKNRHDSAARTRDHDR